MCLVLLLALTVMKITSASYEPGIDTSLVAVTAFFLAIVGKEFDRSDDDGTSA